MLDEYPVLSPHTCLSSHIPWQENLKEGENRNDQARMWQWWSKSAGMIPTNKLRMVDKKTESIPIEDRKSIQKDE